ncbi:hypothetical protein [Kitasatospora sp. NPDC004272]
MSSSRRVAMSTLVGGTAKAKVEAEGADSGDQQTGRLIYVKTDRLLPNPHNPRDAIGDLEDLKSIAEIQRQSLLIVTRAAYLKLYPAESEALRGIDYVVVNGCRRHAAAVKWGRPQLACAVNDTVAKTKASLARAAYDENVERRDFDPIEDAKAVMKVVAEYPTAKEAAAAEGWSEGWISQRKSLLRLHPEVQDLVRLHSHTGGKEGIAIRSARKLAAVKGIEAMSSAEQLAELERIEGEAAAKKGEAAARKAALKQDQQGAAANSRPPASGPAPGGEGTGEFTAVNSGAPAPAPAPVPTASEERGVVPGASAAAAAAATAGPDTPAAGPAEFTAVNSGGRPDPAAGAGDEPAPAADTRESAQRPGAAQESGPEFTAVNSGAPADGSAVPGQRDEPQPTSPAEGVDWHNVDAFAEAILKRLSHEEAYKLADAIASRVREAVSAKA